MTEACIFLALLGITAYAVLGGADFGAGFWDLTAGGAERGGRIRGVIERSMHAVWEVNHVWLIFVLVVLWTCFPKFFGSAMSSLAMPMLIAALGIILRGTAFAVRGQAATLNEARALGAVFALSSVIVPFALGAAIGGIASGRVPVGNAEADPWSVWLNPTSILIGVLAVAAGAYLAAIYLAGDSQKIGLGDMVEAFRKRALGAALVTGVIAIGGLFVLREDASSLYDGLTSGFGFVCVIGSAVFGGLTLGLVWQRRFALARWSSAAAVAAIIAGWAAAQNPYLLPGELTLDAAAAPDVTLQALLIAVCIGVVLLAPALVWLYRLALAGTISDEFEPLDKKFQKPEEGEDAA